MLQSFDAVDIDDVTHGEAAVALIARKGFDVILCDYNLGYIRKDGQQARRETIQTNNLGVRLVEEGKREEAIAHFEKATQNLGGNKIVNTNAQEASAVFRVSCPSIAHDMKNSPGMLISSTEEI